MNMKNILPLLLLSSCSPAYADGTDWSRRMELDPNPVDPVCFSLVVVEDRVGTYNKPETLETSRGPVTVFYNTVGGHADAPDYAEVVDLPPNVAAYPMVLDLVPGEKRSICLMDYIGM